MNRSIGTIRCLTSVVIVVVAGCGGGSGRATPSGPGSAIVPASPAPSATETLSSQTIAPVTPSPAALEPTASRSESIPIPPLTQTFHSPTMGYSVRYPEGWTVFEASKPWRAGEADDWDAPNGDRIESADAGFRGGSQPLAPGQSAQAWIDGYLTTQVTWCGVREQIPLGGTQATIDLNGCPGLGRLGGQIFDLVAVVGGRAYNFTTEGNIDRGFLLAMLATVEFDPSSAAD